MIFRTKMKRSESKQVEGETDSGCSEFSPLKVSSKFSLCLAGTARLGNARKYGVFVI